MVICCRSRKDVIASEPNRLSSNKRNPTPSPSTAATSAGERLSISSSSSSLAPHVSLRSSLPDTASIFSASEISAAISNPTATHFPRSSSHCLLRDRDVFVCQRAFRGDPETLPARLAEVCKSHHRNIVRLLGASVSTGHIHLVYDFATGASLSACLRNARNLAFTPLSSWISRMQIAADLSQALDYIHHHAGGGGFVHNRISSSGVIVTEAGFNAKVCYFGADLLAGDIDINKLRRSDSRSVKIEGSRGYLAPEVIAGGCATKKSDVFAFGVVLLELISGDEPLKYMLNVGKEKSYEWVSLAKTAREVVGFWEDGSPESVFEDRVGRVRRFVDRRLKDSFPLEVVEKLAVVALRCLETDAAKRPGMSWVQGKISKLFLESKAWSENVIVPVEISASFAPR